MLDSTQVLQAVNAGQPVRRSTRSCNTRPIVSASWPTARSRASPTSRARRSASPSSPTRSPPKIALDLVGIELEEVKTFVVGNQGPVMATALRDKTIDAFAGGSADRAALEAQGVKFRNITPDAVSQVPGNVFASGARHWKRSADLLTASCGLGPRPSMPASSTPRRRFAPAAPSPEHFENLEVGMRMINYGVFNDAASHAQDYGELQPDVWKRLQPPYINAGEIKAEIDPADLPRPVLRRGRQRLHDRGRRRPRSTSWKSANAATRFPEPRSSSSSLDEPAGRNLPPRHS